VPNRVVLGSLETSTAIAEIAESRIKTSEINSLPLDYSLPWRVGIMPMDTIFDMISFFYLVLVIVVVTEDVGTAFQIQGEIRD